MCSQPQPQRRWYRCEFGEDADSHDYPMFGSVSERFYKMLVGIQLEPEIMGSTKSSSRHGGQPVRKGI